MTEVIRMSPRSAPAPFADAGLDVRDLPLTMDADKLLKHGNGTLADPETFKASILLLCAAWREVPAGSLPNDDAVIRGLVGLSRHVELWRGVRDAALRGFTLCSDGRLYHWALCDRARAAADSRRLSTPPAGDSGHSGEKAADPVDSPGRVVALSRGPSPRRATETGLNGPSITESQDRADSSYRGDRGVRGEARKTAGTVLPDGWTPSADEFTYGRSLGLDDSQIAAYAEEMRLWSIANGHRRETRKAGAKGWSAAFKGWMRREVARKAGFRDGRPPKGFFQKARHHAERGARGTDERHHRANDPRSDG